MSNAVETRPRVYEDAYRRVRARITAWASSNRLSKRMGGWTDRFIEYLLVFPDMVHLTIRLLLDRTLEPAARGRLIIAMSYLIMPLDFIPDFIPCAGLIDDLLVMAVLLNKTLNASSPEIQERIQTNWAGSPEVFDKVKEVVAVMNEIAAQIPRSLLNYIRRKA